MQDSLSSADRAYCALRDMAAGFQFKPNERINEGQLARDVGVSRTPLREALNRLAAEGFVTFRTGQGFFCRSLDPTDILDLYEARQAVEAETARLAALRAEDADIDELHVYLGEIAELYNEVCPAAELVDLDEQFHMRVAEMAGNRELVRLLANLNARSRFVRLIDMDRRRDITPSDHLRIADALRSRDEERAGQLMREHIQLRREEATEAARHAFSRIYVPERS